MWKYVLSEYFSNVLEVTNLPRNVFQDRFQILSQEIVNEKQIKNIDVSIYFHQSILESVF